MCIDPTEMATVPVMCWGSLDLDVVGETTLSTLFPPISNMFVSIKFHCKFFSPYKGNKNALDAVLGVQRMQQDSLTFRIHIHYTVSCKMFMPTQQLAYWCWPVCKICKGTIDLMNIQVLSEF